MPSPLEVSRIVVTIDGLAGSGKSALAESVAHELGFVNFNSGLIYRIVGALALNENVPLNDETALDEMMSRHEISLGKPGDSNPVLLDGKPYSGNLRTPEVSEATSEASKFQKVRSRLIELQRNAYPGFNLVAEGRDMGTLIFPDAPVKFFVMASKDVRVARRSHQLGVVGEEAKTAITKEILERDKRDAERAVAPTKAAADAITIDNSILPIAETTKKMADIVRQRCNLGPA